MSPELSQNRILAGLPLQEQEVLRPHLRLVLLPTKAELHELNSPITQLHFPIDCAISLLNLQASGRMVEVAVIGREGCSAFPHMPGAGVALARTIVQIGGMAFQLDVVVLESLLPKLPALYSMMNQFGALLFREAVVSVGCSQFHSVEQRLSRWVLSHLHRTGHRLLPFTHDFLADQLGVQRVTVSEALAQLQRNGLVTYGYGKVEIKDVRQLEEIACDCFSLVRRSIADYLNDLKRYADRTSASQPLEKLAS